MNDAVTATYVFDADQWRAAQRLYRKNLRNRIGRVLIGLYAAGCVTLGALLLGGDTGSVVCAPIIISCGLFFASLPLLRLRREWAIFKRSPSYGCRSEVTFRSDRFQVISDKGESDIRLDSFVGAALWPQGMLLFTHPRYFSWIPASGFASAADFDTACAAVKKYVKKTKDRR